jgi:hypothetical protein
MARVDQLRRFGDLVAELAALGAAGLLKLHANVSPAFAVFGDGLNDNDNTTAPLGASLETTELSAKASSPPPPPRSDPADRIYREAYPFPTNSVRRSSYEQSVTTE